MQAALLWHAALSKRMRCLGAQAAFAGASPVVRTSGVALAPATVAPIADADDV
jgi:hypothetical protein